MRFLDWLLGRGHHTDGPLAYQDTCDWLDRVEGFTPPEPTFVSSDAQSRLAEVEQLLADHAKSEGRAPSGSVLQQVRELLDRLNEYERQSP